MARVSSSQAAKLLGIPIENLIILEKQGVIHPIHNTKGVSLYSSEEIIRIKSRRSPTLSQEAAQVGIQVQREIASAVALTRKVLILAGSILLLYVFLIVIFTALFVINPLATAKWLGIVKTEKDISLSAENQNKQVLGAEINTIQERNSPIQTVLQPIAKASLGLVKNINLNSYNQIAKVVILDANDVLGLDKSGAIIPERPISLSESSLLQVGSNGLVANLNSQYLQGRQPGNSPGDIAIVENITPLTNNLNTLNITTGSNIISGLTISNFSSANISQWTNDAGFITNSSISGLTVSDFDSPNISQWTNNSGFIIASSTDTLTNKIISGSTNTFSDIANLSLSNSDLIFTGDTGSGDIALGETLTISGGGINTTTYSGGTITITGTEADTLASVFNRGNSLPTSTGTTPHTIDSATINVGNISSTAQQNFSTLNIANGGTGFLDVELIRGFINFQGMNQLYDDFTDRVLNTTNRWTVTTSGAGSSCSLLAGGLNGLLRMTAGGGINRRCQLSTQSTLTNGYYQRGNNPIFETKLKINNTTNVRIFAGFTNTAPTAGSDTNINTHHAYIEKLAAGTQFQCVTDDGGATETVTSTGVTMSANTFYRLRVEIRNGSIPETICTVDDGTTTIKTVVTNTQPGATNAMDVYEKVETSNTTAKSMDVDYIRAWQDDSPISNNIPEEETSPSPTPTLEEEISANSINDFLKNLVEFFNNVIFHADVTFLGRPIFNKDTAGHAFIKAGDNEVSIVFEKEYAKKPVVTVSVNLLKDTPDEIPIYAVYDLSTQGFKIKLSKTASSDFYFSWIALATNGDDPVKEEPTLTITLSPTPQIQALTPTPTVMQIPTSTPTPITEPTPLPASPSAQLSP